MSYRLPKYLRAHPKSDLGDPNQADALGWDLVGFGSDGYPWFRRKPWWRRRWLVFK